MQLDNDFFHLEFDSRGSEWTNWRDKESGLELAWSGDPDVWAGRNPTLFPHVGRLWQDRLRVDGQTYTLGNHGLARHSDFECVENTPTTLVTRLRASEQTKKVYPFDFILENHYELNDRRLNVTTRVINNDRRPLPFSLGAHPAFRCPLLPSEKISDYRIVFEQKEKLQRLAMDSDGAWASEPVFYADTNTIALHEHIFDEDVLAFAHPQSRQIALVGPAHRITVGCPTARYWGIWSKPGAPFVCLEPWLSHGDVRDYTGEYDARPEMTILVPGAKFDFKYWIQIS